MTRHSRNPLKDLKDLAEPMRKELENPVLMAAAAGLGLFYAARAVVRAGRRFELRDKVVLITGGSRGLGLRLAEQFARAGAHLAVCARDGAELSRCRSVLEDQTRRLLTLRCDVTKREEVEQMVRQVNAQLGPVDVLVNNAGAITVGPMEVMTLEDYELAMKTHFWAPLYATLAVLPGMRERRAGRIVNISSIGGKIAAPHLLPYTASKFALTGLSEGMRLELLKDGIYVTTVCPGLMRTGSPRNAMFKGQHRAEYAWFSIADSLPLTSMSADRAAGRILRACRDGEAQVVLSIQAQLAVKFHALFPGLATDLNGLIAKLLPDPGGFGETAVPGRESTSAWSPSWLTGLTERAAEENNEMGE